MARSMGIFDGNTMEVDDGLMSLMMISPIYGGFHSHRGSQKWIVDEGEY